MNKLGRKAKWMFCLALLVSSGLVLAEPDQPQDIRPQLRDLRDFARQLDEAIGKSTRDLERIWPKLQRDLKQFEGHLRQEAPAFRQQLEDLLKKFKDKTRRWDKQAPKRPDGEVMV